MLVYIYMYEYMSSLYVIVNLKKLQKTNMFNG